MCEPVDRRASPHNGWPGDTRVCSTTNPRGAGTASAHQHCCSPPPGPHARPTARSRSCRHARQPAPLAAPPACCRSLPPVSMRAHLSVGSPWSWMRCADSRASFPPAARHRPLTSCTKSPVRRCVPSTLQDSNEAADDQLQEWRRDAPRRRAQTEAILARLGPIRRDRPRHPTEAAFLRRIGTPRAAHRPRRLSAPEAHGSHDADHWPGHRSHKRA